MKSGNAELDAIAGAAAAADKGEIPDAAAAAPGAPDVPLTPTGDTAQDWAQLPELFGMIVCEPMPELRAVYTHERCLQWGERMVPLAARYGWNVATVMAWAGPWVGVALATWPLAVPTVKAIRAHRAKPAEPTKPLATVHPISSPAPANDDPDLRDPTKTNKPPRPV